MLGPLITLTRINTRAPDGANQFEDFYQKADASKQDKRTSAVSR